MFNPQLNRWERPSEGQEIRELFIFCLLKENASSRMAWAFIALLWDGFFLNIGSDVVVIKSRNYNAIRGSQCNNKELILQSIVIIHGH
jgi:thermostable 8-oxoguanine DNA glycosylase